MARVKTLTVKRRSKYGAMKTVVDGVTFDSKGEARRYGDLRNLERAKEILGLLRQIRFELHVNGVHISDYIADFAYREKGETKLTVEDFKGFRTSEYKLKIKLFQALYPQFHFIETGAPGRATRRRAPKRIRVSGEWIPRRAEGRAA